MRLAGTLVGISVALVAAWFVFVACSPPPLPAECGYTVTVTTRDAAP